MSREGDAAHALMREIYLQDLTLSIYRTYLPRLRDAQASAILEAYLTGERFRASQIELYLGRKGLEPAPVLRFLFRGVGRIYGRITVLLGTRLILRIILSASKRASRGACAGLENGESPPDLLYLNTLRARNEGDLLDNLRQHMINTRPRND